MLLAVMLVLNACGNPDKAWEMAQRDDTPSAYLEFLAKYPDGQQADQARARIEALKVIRAWERTEFKDNQKAYTAFMEKHPDSEFAPEAQSRISAYQRDALWSLVEAGGGKIFLKAFLQRYPDSPQSEQAREMLAAIEAEEESLSPAEPAGDFRLQLAAFRTAESADTELRRLVKLFPDTLTGPVHIETPEERGTGRLFILKSIPMSQDEAETACNALKSFGQDCLIIER